MAKNSQFISDFDATGQYIVIAGGTLAFLFITVAFWYYKTVVNGIADSTSYITIGKFFLQLIDFFTDLFFNVILYLEGKFPVLTWISIGLMLVSYFGSIFTCLFWMIRWKAWQDHVSERLHKYLSKYSVLIIGLTVFSNFYVAIDLLRSKLFYKDAFYFALSKHEYELLNKYRFVNITLGENIAQIIIQIVYLLNSDDISQVSIIVFISIVIGAFAIFLSLMKCCVSDGQSKLHSLESKFGAKLIIDCNFTIKSYQFKKFHAFSHHKIEDCLIQFLENEIESSIASHDNPSIIRKDVSLSCDVYYIENIIRLQEKLKIHFIMKILHYKDNLTLANGIYNILSSLTGTKNDNNNSEITILNDKTTTDISKLKLGPLNDINIDLSPQGKKKFVEMIAKTLKIENNSEKEIGIELVNTSSHQKSGAPDDALIIYE